MLRRRTVLRGLGTGVVASVAGCSADGGTAGVETSSVSMVDEQFDPRNVRVDAGTTVTWTNEDPTAHTVTSASDDWNVDVEVPGGETVSHTFENAGVYGVYCRFHGSRDLTGMSMKVAVGDATIAEPLGDGGDGGGGAYGRLPRGPLSHSSRHRR
ncbi:MAG: cupredoxin domain-containing protein [Haloferacaceae archaeon]